MAKKKDQILIAHKLMINEIFNTENAYIVEIKIQEPRISQMSRSLLSPIWSYPNRSKSAG